MGSEEPWVQEKKKDSKNPYIPRENETLILWAFCMALRRNIPGVFFQGPERERNTGRADDVKARFVGPLCCGRCW